VADPRDIRLPDIPNAGYSTRREKELSDAIMLFMRKVERDRVWLLSIVIDGRDKFKFVMRKQYRGMDSAVVLDDLIDKIYDWFELAAGKYPLQQRDALLHMDNRSKYGLM
jgi:hypothetical protein